jgi:hypothetical protein
MEETTFHMWRWLWTSGRKRLGKKWHIFENLTNFERHSRVGSKSKWLVISLPKTSIQKDKHIREELQKWWITFPYVMELKILEQRNARWITVSEHSVSHIASAWRSEGQSYCSLSNIRTRVQHCLQLVFIKTMFTLLFFNQQVRQAYVMQECIFMVSRADHTAKRRLATRAFCSRPYSSSETKCTSKTCTLLLVYT